MYGRIRTWKRLEYFILKKKTNSYRWVHNKRVQNHPKAIEKPLAYWSACLLSFFSFSKDDIMSYFCTPAGFVSLITFNLAGKKTDFIEVSIDRVHCTTISQQDTQHNKCDMGKPAIQFLHWKDKIDHNGIPYNSINQTKSNKPSEFTDVDFSFNRKQNQHRAPSKSLNNQWNYLSIDDITALIIIVNIC